MISMILLKVAPSLNKFLPRLASRQACRFLGCPGTALIGRWTPRLAIMGPGPSHRSSFWKIHEPGPGLARPFRAE